MTETEAKEKICHIMPAMVQGGYCIASKCMAWQKYEPSEFRLKADKEFFNGNGTRLYNPHGYCSQGAKPLDL